MRFDGPTAAGVGCVRTMSTAKSLPLAALLLVAGACSKGYDNPFAGTAATAPLPARAAIVFSSNSYGSAGSPNELFAIEASGAGLTQLTFCNQPDRPCANLEATVAPDRSRAAVRRVLTDSNRDGRLDGHDDAGLVFLDFSRGVEASLLPETARVSGVDWSPTEELLLLSAAGEAGLDDLFTLSPNGQNRQNLTSSAGLRERRPRFNSLGSTGIYEQIDETSKGQVYVLFVSQPRITTGGPGTEPLPGTPWVVGSDADPDFSPDGRLAVFRRLTGTGNGGLGTWDVMTVNLANGSLATVASGPAYRGAPDWGSPGIVFSEADPGGTRLVMLQPDGSDRRVLLTVASSFDLSNPRWLP